MGALFLMLMFYLLVLIPMQLPQNDPRLYEADGPYTDDVTESYFVKTKDENLEKVEAVAVIDMEARGKDRYAPSGCAIAWIGKDAATHKVTGGVMRCHLK